MIPLFKVHMPESVDKAVLETLHSGYIGQGPKVEEFEQQLSAYFGNPRVLTLNSATSGIHLALRLAGVGPGDEVISTPMTCAATNTPILAAGARIVWADVHQNRGLISPASIQEKITPRTKAIMVVHYAGIPCDMEEIGKIANRHRIRVIEDAAHALGASYQGKHIGNHSDFVVFSLQAIKHITTIDGGILLCRDFEDFTRAKLLRWYGLDRDQSTAPPPMNDIVEYGYKYHMNDIGATIGMCQLPHLSQIVSRHTEHRQFYDQELSSIPGIELVEQPEDRESAAWMYVIHVPQRGKFVDWMAERGIMVSPVHRRNDLYTCFREFRSHLPNLDLFDTTQIAIPVGWWLNNDDLDKIVTTIREFARSIQKPARKQE